MIARFAAHGIVIGIDRVETCIAVPGFVKVQTIGGFFQQILCFFSVITHAVIGAVGHHAVRRFLPGFVFSQRAFIDFLLQGFRLHFLRIDWPDNAVAVAAWHHVDRFRTCQHQALFDGFMAVTVNDHDIVIGHASLHDGAVRAGSTDDYRPGAIGTKYACGIFFAFAKCASMVKQRTEGSSFDAHVGAEQIFTIVVMVETSGGCFSKTNAALVAWRCPGIFMDVAIFHQRAEQWRQQLLAVAGHRGNGASGDKVGSIFQNPGEFIDKLQQIPVHCGEGFFPIAQQEDRHVLLALMKLTDQLSDVLMFVRMFHLIAEHQAVNGFV